MDWVDIFYVDFAWFDLEVDLFLTIDTFKDGIDVVGTAHILSGRGRSC